MTLQVTSADYHAVAESISWLQFLYVCAKFLHLYLILVRH